MNYTTIQSLFNENRTNIRGAAAFDTVRARTCAGAPLFFRQITRLIFGIKSMNYTTIQYLFDENRTNIRGAVAF
jgi:hypothetical protein